MKKIVFTLLSIALALQLNADNGTSGNQQQTMKQQTSNRMAFRVQSDLD